MTKIPISIFAPIPTRPTPIWSLSEDRRVNVEGYVEVNSTRIEELPYIFKEVSGSFHCENNKMTTLFGCPEKVGGGFFCYHNMLVSLEHAPKEVGGDFYCGYNARQFTEQEVRDVCDVKGDVYV